MAYIDGSAVIGDFKKTLTRKRITTITNNAGFEETETTTTNFNGLIVSEISRINRDNAGVGIENDAYCYTDEIELEIDDHIEEENGKEWKVVGKEQNEFLNNVETYKLEKAE